MAIFVDFETNGLYGEVTEAYALDDNGNCLGYFNIKNKNEEENKEKRRFKFKLQKDNNENNKLFLNFDSMMEFLCSLNDEIVFWHSYMPAFLCKKYENVYEYLKGNFVCFTDFYAIFDGLKCRRYKIADITENLIQREHQGNAEDDCKDLYECFQIVKA